MALRLKQAVRDIVRRRTGTVIARSEYAFGSPRVLVALDGFDGDEEWFDEARFEPLNDDDESGESNAEGARNV